MKDLLRIEGLIPESGRTDFIDTNKILRAAKANYDGDIEVRLAALLWALPICPLLSVIGDAAQEIGALRAKLQEQQP